MKKSWLLLLFPIMAFALPDWIRVKIDEHVSIEFPSQPQKQNVLGNIIWLQNVDSNSRCMAASADFADYGMDSTVLAMQYAKDSFMMMIRDHVMSQVKGCRVISQYRIQVDDHLAYEFAFEKPQPDSSFIFKKFYTRDILAGTKMYTLSFYEKPNTDDKASRERFFHSFRIE